MLFEMCSVSLYQPWKDVARDIARDCAVAPTMNNTSERVNHGRKRGPLTPLPECLQSSLPAEFLNLVDIFAAPVVPSPRVTLCIFVGGTTPHSFTDVPRRKILRGDELQTLNLSSLLFREKIVHLGVALRQGFTSSPLGSSESPHQGC